MMSKGENLLALHTTYTCAFTCYIVQRNIDSIQKLELFTILQKEEFVRIKRFDCFEECQSDRTGCANVIQSGLSKMSRTRSSYIIKFSYSIKGNYFLLS